MNIKRGWVHSNLLAVVMVISILMAAINVKGEAAAMMSEPSGQTSLPARVTSGSWQPMSSGMNGYVEAIALDDYGNVYAGGYFTSAGNCSSADGCNRIAVWDGVDWSALASGVSGLANSYVYAIAVHGSDVYVGGMFSSAGTCTVGCNNIARWDGTSWWPLGSGTDLPVWAITVDASGIVYAGGLFTSAGACDSMAGCNGIARWSGGQWSALGSGVFGNIHSITFHDGSLYAGGEFSNAGSCMSGCNGIARWNGSDWVSVGDGIAGGVWSLSSGSGGLYVAGMFTGAGSCSGTDGCNHIARWDGVEWSALGSGTNQWTWVVKAIGDEVYAGGAFNGAGSCDSTDGCNQIAKWDGTTWSPLDTGTKDMVHSMDVGEGTVYAGGYFSSPGACTSGCRKIARYIDATPIRFYLPLVNRVP